MAHIILNAVFFRSIILWQGFSHIYSHYDASLTQLANYISPLTKQPLANIIE